MANVIKINSKLGMVTFSKEDLLEHDLYRWIRTDSKGRHQRNFIDQQPFEKAAAHVFHKEYPSHTVKRADKAMITADGAVDVFLSITADISKGYYNSHPTKLVFSKDEKTGLGSDVKEVSELANKNAFHIEMDDLRDIIEEFFHDNVDYTKLDLNDEYEDEDEMEDACCSDDLDMIDLSEDLDVDDDKDEDDDDLNEMEEMDFDNDDNDDEISVVKVKDKGLDSLEKEELEEMLKELTGND